ncbi:hypothetical protein HY480_00100 [Candidatus Uhrbacteria bacterium]|nr:hypothetical protein [Candidatus Uhrbacteria bacterium]
MFASLWRLLKFGGQDFTRNIWLTTTTVIILALTLLSVHVLIGVNVLGRTAIADLESRMDLRIQFRPDVSESDADAVRLQLHDRAEVAEVTQRSRADVLAAFTEAHRTSVDVTDALAELGENPFGPELRVRLRAPSEYPAIRRILEEPALASRIAETSAADRLALTAQLTNVTSRMRSIGLVVSGIFLLITLLIIVNAMRIATYTRREEAAIMKLVGAPNWFIRTPFLIMGVITSAIATLIAQGITIPALHAMLPSFTALVGPRGIDVFTFFRYHILTIGGIEFLGLSLLTTLVSAIAIRKYLRV